jgi:hypothetical protein
MTRAEIIQQIQHHAAEVTRLTALLGGSGDAGSSVDPGGRLLTVGEAATKWRCAEITVRRLAKDHPRIAERFGGKLLIRPDAPRLIENDHA